MKKLFSLIFVLGLLLGGVASAKDAYLVCKYIDKEKKISEKITVPKRITEIHYKLDIYSKKLHQVYFHYPPLEPRSYLINENFSRLYKEDENYYYFFQAVPDFKDENLEKLNFSELVEKNNRSDIKIPYEILKLNKFNLKILREMYYHPYKYENSYSLEKNKNKLKLFSEIAECTKENKKI